MAVDIFYHSPHGWQDANGREVGYHVQRMTWIYYDTLEAIEVNKVTEKQDTVEAECPECGHVEEECECDADGIYRGGL